MLRAVVFAVALACFSVFALGQTTQPDKKGDAGKAKEEPKGKKEKTPLDKSKLPKDTASGPVDDLIAATQEIQELREKLKALARQPKVDKKTPYSCKLLDGVLDPDNSNALLFRVEFRFSTEVPKTTVVLGLQGGHLRDTGDLDGNEPILDYTDEGFVARIDKKGTYVLTLKLRVPLQLKKAATGSIERGIELGLPGAAVTIVDVQLPGSVKELRWNETLEKSKTSHWLFGLEKAKSLSLAWKEPAPIQGNTPLAKAEGQVNVTIDQTHVTINADILLEDIRPLTKEWHLLLPASAKITDVKLITDAKLAADFKKLNGVAHPFASPAPGTPYWKITDLTPDKYLVTLTQRIPRPAPGARIPIGPFHVLGAFQHHGTINVQMPTDVAFGQRLIHILKGETYQLKKTETEASFQYIAAPAANVKAAQALKAPLELEWRKEKNQLETNVEHALKLKAVPQGWEVEATTRIQAKGLVAFNAVELKLPMRNINARGMSVLGTLAPGAGFPAGLPWGGMWKTFGAPWTFAGPEDITILDDKGNPLKLVPQDATGKTRVIAERAPEKQMTLVLKNTFKIPAQHQRIRVELPRPLDTQDRGAKVSLQTDERMELLYGAAGAEEPVPERHHFEFTLDQAPGAVDVAWRPFERAIVAHGTLDITLFEHSAQVRQRLSFPRDRSPAGVDLKNAQVAFKIPRDVDRVKVIDGADGANQDLERRMLWVKPKDDRAEKIELVLEYDLTVTKKKAGADAQTARTLEVTPLWPDHVSQKDVKVRVWCPTGVQPRLSAELASRGTWKERSIELVKDKDQFPALVLAGYGASLPLTLWIGESAAAPVAAFLADRALLQVRMGDDDSQQVQARYWIRKMHATHVEVELPLPPARLRDLHFTIGKHAIFPEKKGAGDKVVRLPLYPEQVVAPAILEINYVIPADGMERNYFWRTTLLAPSFRSDVLIGQQRWQFTAPAPMIAASVNRKARPDTRWDVHNWLFTPEPSVTSAALDAWLTGVDGGQAEENVTYAFTLSSAQPETLYHLPRAWWLLGCSGLLLVMTLGTYFSPLPRVLFWIFMLALGFGLLTLEVVCPAALPPILFGLQPGAVLFVFVVGVYWILQERYRRQLVFLPGFTRTKQPGSTVQRTSSSKRPREKSTLDALPSEPEAAANPPAGS